MRRPIAIVCLIPLLACSSEAAVSMDASAPDGVADAYANDAIVDAAKDTTADADAGNAMDAADASDAGFDCTTPAFTDAVLAGTPTWKTAEVVIFGTTIEPFNVFNAAILDVVKPTHKYDAMNNLFLSAQAHMGPYTSELITGLNASSYTQSACFPLSDVTSPKGIVILVNLVPTANAPFGKSFEQTNGRVFSGGFHVDGDLYDDLTNTLVDPNFDGQTYGAAVAYNDNTLDGFGHMVLQFGEDQNLTPKPLVVTTYRFELWLVDGTGTVQTKTIVRFKLQ